MGLLTGLLGAPFGPVRGIVWALDQALAAAEREYYDPTPFHRELAELEGSLLAGDIDQAEFDRREDELLDRLERIRPTVNPQRWEDSLE
ncbi:gas vesicle protein GvpG [Streptomyces sp. NBC_00878]|uniref:gas vesicle protein GvpG n=1 Tax=Streptomyces sp. NBC_00878 TaxID=2975854 RepID=UPI00225862A6|nr:gas vesicle protein GvpG [Streptomyces sp. NBC_00878]MCX4906904.1 gas vesicle protein GvpG [Streptomyces sp. NBC_00878]